MPPKSFLSQTVPPQALEQFKVDVEQALNKFHGELHRLAARDFEAARAASQGTIRELQEQLAVREKLVDGLRSQAERNHFVQQKLTQAVKNAKYRSVYDVLRLWRKETQVRVLRRHVQDHELALKKSQGKLDFQEKLRLKEERKNKSLQCQRFEELRAHKDEELAKIQELYEEKLEKHKRRFKELEKQTQIALTKGMTSLSIEAIRLFGKPKHDATLGEILRSPVGMLESQSHRQKRSSRSSKRHSKHSSRRKSHQHSHARATYTPSQLRPQSSPSRTVHDDILAKAEVMSIETGSDPSLELVLYCGV